MREDNKKLVRRYYQIISGDMAGIAPKGNRLRIPAISTFRIAGGKLAEAWEIYDSGDMLRQMRE